MPHYRIIGFKQLVDSYSDVVEERLPDIQSRPDSNRPGTDQPTNGDLDPIAFRAAVDDIDTPDSLDLQVVADTDADIAPHDSSDTTNDRP